MDKPKEERLKIVEDLKPKIKELEDKLKALPEGNYIDKAWLDCKELPFGLRNLTFLLVTLGRPWGILKPCGFYLIPDPDCPIVQERIRLSKQKHDLEYKSLMNFIMSNPEKYIKDWKKK